MNSRITNHENYEKNKKITGVIEIKIPNDWFIHIHENGDRILISPMAHPAINLYNFEKDFIPSLYDSNIIGRNSPVKSLPMHECSLDPYHIENEISSHQSTNTNSDSDDMDFLHNRSDSSSENTTIVEPEQPETTSPNSKSKCNIH